MAILQTFSFTVRTATICLISKNSWFVNIDTDQKNMYANSKF